MLSFVFVITELNAFMQTLRLSSRLASVNCRASLCPDFCTDCCAVCYGAKLRSSISSYSEPLVALRWYTCSNCRSWLSEPRSCIPVHPPLPTSAHHVSPRQQHQIYTRCRSLIGEILRGAACWFGAEEQLDPQSHNATVDGTTAIGYVLPAMMKAVSVPKR
jgi:hypothetical protein